MYPPERAGAHGQIFNDYGYYHRIRNMLAFRRFLTRLGHFPNQNKYLAAMTRPAAPVARRELTRAHVAFYRAVVEGVERRKAWELYLSLDGDFSDAHCAATLEWVRQTLIAEAMSAGQPELIGLFRRDPERVRVSERPTLNEFATQFADAGEFSEAELTELWKEQYGEADGSDARRARLSRRLRDALLLVEKAGRKQAQATDPVAMWLAPRLSSRLAEAGLHTLADVRSALDRRKTPRWEEVPGVGEVWADRLAAWLAQVGIQAPSQPPTTLAPAHPLRPLERLTEAELHPQPFADEPLVPVPRPAPADIASDKDAVERWLSEKGGNRHTLRVYRRASERLLLWCQLERQRPFGRLTPDDGARYCRWLSQLGRQPVEVWAAEGWRLPADAWISTARAARRDSPKWRPFEGPLSPASVRQDLAVVKALFAFLRRRAYLSNTPWEGVRPVETLPVEDGNDDDAKGTRMPARQDWVHLLEGLQQAHPTSDRNARLRVVLWLGLGCGLKASEMLGLTVGSLAPTKDGWQLRVAAGAANERQVPLPAPATAALFGYLEQLGLDGRQVPTLSADVLAAPLLRSQKGRRAAGRGVPSEGLRYTQLYTDLKSYFASRARELEPVDPAAAARIRRASTQWLRYSCAAASAEAGIGITGIQQLLGHAHVRSTAAYFQDSEPQLQSATERVADLLLSAPSSR